MTAPRFIEIHWLTAYPAALLNRDQDGLGKRMPFGGVLRGRVSSQCIKRHLRFAGAADSKGAKANEWSLQALPGLTDLDFGKRSRKHLSEALVAPLVEAGASADLVETWAEKLIARIMKKKEGKEKDTESDDSDENDDEDVNLIDTKQAFLLGNVEIRYLQSLLKKLVDGDAELRAGIDANPKKKGLSKEEKKNLNQAQQKVLKQIRKDFQDNLNTLIEGAIVPTSIEAALFGRMVTSDVIANTDAPVHVAHALTVHPIEREMDFMAVVDDLKREDDSADAGAAGTFDAELTSGLYYNYMVVDVALLVSNLGGDAKLAGQVVERLIHLAAEVSPGAKKGSTAPYAYAELMLVEAGNRQPRTLGNAFREPVKARTNTMFQDTLNRLAAYIGNIDAAYGNHRRRMLMAIDPSTTLPDAPRASLDDLAAWAGELVAAAKAADAA
jgi:CRISPR system Cascade subunit CasC